MGEEKLILIDGNGYIHRAYHAIPKLTDTNGNIVNAVFGFVKMLKKIITQEKPTHIFIAFDHRKPTFRHRDFKEYKANRKKTEPELVEQFPKVFKILESLNMKFISYEGFEADDIIATITRLARKQDIAVDIVTCDKDILQLVSDEVKVINGMKDIKYDIHKTEEKFGVKPSCVIDYMALIGDKSDNLPGVKGIGPVTAKKLLKQYKDLDGIYENLSHIELNVKEKLEKYKKDAYMTQKLVKLIEDVELPVTIDDCLWEGPDNERLKEELEELNFRSLISDWMEVDEHKDKIAIKIIRKQEGLEKYLKRNFSKDTLCMELVLTENLTGIGICFDNENLCYIPVAHSYLGVGNQLKWEEVKEVFKEYLFKKERICIAYDFKSMYKFFRKEDIKLSNSYFDVIAADYVLNPATGEKSFKNICSKYLGMVVDEISDKPAEKNIEEIAGCLSNRLVAVFELSEILPEKIKEQKVEELFEKVEIPVLKILAEMELTGIRIDAEEMRKTRDEFKRKLKEIENEIFDITNEKFNVNSSRQLAMILYGKLGLKPVRKMKTGYSTAEDVLHSLAGQHKLPEKVLEYRKLQKLISTYVEPLPLMMDLETKRLHTTFNITGTQTGRLSSSNPNLQNIPVKTAHGRIIRKMFIPETGKIFLSADYSQIDLRVLAHISEDKNLIESFNEGKDIHSLTAAKIFGVDESCVTPDMRKKAKAINFGIVYGMSSWGLSKRVDMTVDESKAFIEKYFNEYPGIENYVARTIAKAKAQLFVTTILNRRRYLPEINSSNPMRRRLFERMAVNTPVQGSSADIIKAAMVELNKEFAFNEGPVKLLLQIHDELLFEIPGNDISDIKNKIKEKMEGAIRLSVPVVVDFRKGKTWGDLEKM